MKKGILLILMGLISLSIFGCDSSSPEKNNSKDRKVEIDAEPSKNLPFLTIKEQPAKIALPFCEHKNCIEINIQTIQTQDQWINSWINKSQATVIQNLLGMKQNLNLQQAVDVFVKQSDLWQAKSALNSAYELNMYTRMAYQRNKFTLLQISVDIKQKNVNDKEIYYYFVADRKQKKRLNLFDIVDSKHQTQMNDIIQIAYQKWITEQSFEVRQQAPKKLYWRRGDWFFDQEGIGLHYRKNEIVKEGKQLNIYLTKSQTQQILKAEIYAQMF